MKKIYLNELGVLCALGSGKAEVARNLFAGVAPGMQVTAQYSPVYLAQTKLMLGLVQEELPALATQRIEYQSRNNRLLLAALQQIQPAVEKVLQHTPAERVGVVIGTSTSGMAEAEAAMRVYQQHGHFPPQFHYEQQALGSTSGFLAEALSVSGPTYTVSTACSSGAKVLASAQRLIQTGICDAVLAGGVDTLCAFTIAGFSSLESVSAERCNPFSANRKGINIGEAAALFLVTAEPGPVALCGVGESSDGHHISAPEPGGRGARLAIQDALRNAGLQATDIDYLNLHGTATPQNDAMEARVVHDLFGAVLPVSGTKALTGHTLGAAGALEAAFCWLALQAENQENRLPPHVWDGVPDPDLPVLHFVAPSERAARLRYALSSSFAFGGNNVAVVLGRES